MGQKINNIFATKIQELVAEDKIDDAIIELSKLANNSNWTREVIMQSAKFNDIEKHLRNGTLSFEEVTIHKNRVRNAILDISSRINNSTNNSLKEDIETIEKWDKKEEVIAILESIYKIVNSILIENEEILSPLFTHNYNIEEVHDKMVLLFNNQRNRGNFKRWIIYLTKQLKSDSLPEGSITHIKNAIHLLNEFFRFFYEKVPQDLKGNNLKIAINELQDEYPPTKGIVANIINPSQNYEVREMQVLASRYLDDIRNAVEDFGESIEWLK